MVKHNISKTRIGKNFKRKKKKIFNFLQITTQYCYICGEMTIFEYDKNLGHKVCRNCGKRKMKKFW